MKNTWGVWILFATVLPLKFFIIDEQIIPARRH